MGNQGAALAMFQGRAARNLPVLAVAAIALALAGCTSSKPKRGLAKGGKEYFAESEYGVKASPRVTTKASGLPRGGGREQIGRPYQIKGKWYRPGEKAPGHTREGHASWYGSAFHGRLTANGEIYDRTHLTAAHPTMPLPSYARVTNLANNSSVVVRVNDRGPFARGRIIDLSERAADLLDYKQSGVAKVKVEYIGRAPLHGQDDSYLIASYRPGGSRGPGPAHRPGVDDGLPSGVMIAMAGPTPSAPSRQAPRPVPASLPQPAPAPRPEAPAVAFPPPPAMPAAPVQLAGLDTPDTENRPSVPVPIPAPREHAAMGETTQTAMSFLFYAGRTAGPATAAFRAFEQGREKAAWKVQQLADRQEPSVRSSGEYIAAGTFSSQDEAERLAAVLGAHGRASIETGEGGFSVLLSPDGRYDMDRLLAIAWSSGAPDAIPVRE